MAPTDAQSLAALVEAGEAAAVDEALHADPMLVHRHVPRDRPWGEEQWLPLHRAAAQGDAAMVACLLDRGAQPDGRTRFRTPDHARATALHVAASAGAVEVMRLLLERGASLEVRDAAARSPVGVAAAHGQPGAARLLIDRGAQLEVADAHGRTPLHLAIASITEPSGDAVDAALALIDGHAYINATCPNEPAGFTPLHRCIAKGAACLPVARRLIAAGADVHAFDPVDNRTPLELARALAPTDEQTMRAYVALLAPDEPRP